MCLSTSLNSNENDFSFEIYYKDTKEGFWKVFEVTCDNEAPQTGVFKKWLNNTLGNNTIECKKLATIVSGRKT